MVKMTTKEKVLSVEFEHLGITLLLEYVIKGKISSLSYDIDTVCSLNKEDYFRRV